MAKKKTIYVFHEYGAKSHYYALVELAKQEGYNVNSGFSVFVRCSNGC